MPRATALPLNQRPNYGKIVCHYIPSEVNAGSVLCNEEERSIEDNETVGSLESFPLFGDAV